MQSISEIWYEEQKKKKSHQMHQGLNTGKAADSSMGQKWAHCYQDNMFNLA